MLARDEYVKAAREAFRGIEGTGGRDWETYAEPRSGLEAEDDGLRRAREKEGRLRSLVVVRVVVVVDAILR